MASGFYIPKSVSSEFVPNQRNAEGNYKYDQALAEVGLNQQAALASINKDYSETINKAYSSYLTANRAVRGSAMGQGYKEAYEQANQENLIQQIAETNKTAANARYQIASNSSQAIGNINDQMNLEISNMNRVAYSANDYLKYLATLADSKDASKTYLTQEQIDLINQNRLTADTMYDTIFGAQPQAYLDADGNVGMTYIQWLNQNLKDNEADRAWSQWLFSQGGYNQFVAATKKGVKPL